MLGQRLDRLERLVSAGALPVGKQLVAADPAQSVYARLLDIVTHAPGVEHFSFDSAALMAPENSVIGMLSVAIETPADAVAGIRFSNNTINGQFLPDAYIYRLTGPSRSG